MKKTFICVICRGKTGSSVCEEVLDMILHNISCHGTYPLENVLTEGVAVKTYEIRFSVFSNSAVSKSFFHVGE